MNKHILETLFLELDININSFTVTDILIRLLRFFPLIIKNFHILELGPPNTGKSFSAIKFKDHTAQATSLTISKWFGNMKNNEVGYINSSNHMIFIDEISNLNDSDFSTELKSSLKTYLNGDFISRINSKETSSSSIFFAGNTPDSIQEEVDICPKNLSEKIYSNLPYFFRENAMKERLIYNPGWLLSNNQEFNFLNSSSVNCYFNKFISENRNSFNNEIKIPCSENVRICKKYRKIISGLILLLYNKDFSQNNIDECFEFSKFIVNITNNKYNTFWKTTSGKKFILNFLDLYLPKNNSLKRIFFSDNRVFVSIKEDPSKLYKIALNKYGIEENKKEFFFSEKYNTEILPLLKKEDPYFITVSQPFAIPLNLSNEFILNNYKSLESLNLEINNLKIKFKKDKDMLISKYNELLDYIISSKYLQKKVPDFISIDNTINDKLNFSSILEEIHSSKLKDSLDTKKIKEENIGFNPETKRYYLISFFSLIIKQSINYIL